MHTSARHYCAVLLACLYVLEHGQATQAPPRFILNLNKPASERWAGAVDAVLAQHSFESGFGHTFEQYNRTIFSNLNESHWVALAKSLTEHFLDQAVELQSIAEQFQQRGHYVSFEYLAGWVYSHELMHSDLLSLGQRSEVSRSCTGIVVQDADGQIMHGANMDQSPKNVRKVTMQVDVKLDDEIIISGVDWYWFTTGFTRAVRKGVAALSEDWRDTGVLKHQVVMQHIEAGAVPQVFMFRKILLGHSSGWSDGFVELLREVRMAAPMYIIAAGTEPGQGLVMARSADGSDGELSLSGPDSKWFIAQSNYEPWWPDPKSDPRKTAAVAMLSQFGQPLGADAVGLFAVLSTFPVLNPNTAYTTVMRPAAGTLQAFVRDASCPETTKDFPFPDPRYCQPAGKGGWPRGRELQSGVQGGGVDVGSFIDVPLVW